MGQRREAQVRARTLALAGIATAAMLSASHEARAGATISFGDGQSVSIGLGVRTDFTESDDTTASGQKVTRDDIELSSLRLYVNAVLNNYIKATFNTTVDTTTAGDQTLKVLDGYVRFEFADEFNLWVGRMLPPSDRSNLDGPYYLSSWNYPGVVSDYPGKIAGRDDGATVWGKLLDKHLVYSIGVFEGAQRFAGSTLTSTTQASNLLTAARIVYNFLDVEDNPAYYEASTYYGGADILTIGFAVQHQAHEASADNVTFKDFTGYNVDGLFEKKLFDGGAVTLEGAYYKYDTGGVIDAYGGLPQGEAYLGSVGFLFPTKIWVGKFQPVVRFQELDSDLGTKPTTRQTDLSLNYIIDGFNARIMADYGIKQVSGKSTDDSFTLGIQAQF